MKNIRITIDGKILNCSPEASILNIAEENGIYIPTLCNHSELEPYGACRICIVEDKKSNRILASCVTPVKEGMVIHTASPRVISHRRNIIRLMMAEHPESCLFCTKSNKCELRKIAAELGIGESNLDPMPNYIPIDQSNPFIFRDMTKCILCGKCIRACKELVVNGTIDYNLRGFKSRPSTAGKLPLGESDCLFCGTCASICPTGAITQSTGIYSDTAEREHESICGFCGVGCSVTLGIKDNRIIAVNPSGVKNSVNGITLCVRGHFGLDYLNSPKRLSSPMIRKNDELVEASWETAINSVSERLMDIKENYGAESIAFYGSSKCTNEENYLFQKIARVGIGTANIDNGGFIYGRNLMKFIDKRTGVSCRINKYEDFQKTDLIFAIGAEPAESLPVLNYHIKRAVKKGAILIVLDHNNTDLAKLADIWIRPISGINITEHYTLLINSLSASLYKKSGLDLPFVGWFTKNYDDFCEELCAFDIEESSKKTGIGIELIKKTASLIEAKKISFVIGEEILEQKKGQIAIDAIINLSLISGCFACQGCGFHVLSRENNLIGSWDMGTVPDMLPGRKPLDNEKNRKSFESAWNKDSIAQKGLDMPGMIKAAEEGKLKALYIMGENPLRSLPQANRIKQAFKKLELLVVQDILENETTIIADIVLPGAASIEKSGSFTNMEGRIQSFTQAVQPPFNAKSDFEILGLIAAKTGIKTYSLEKTRKEIITLVPLYSELAESSGKTWLQRELNGNIDNNNYKKIIFSPIEQPRDKKQDKDYPFIAVIGSRHFHSGSGTRTSMSELIKKSPFKGEIELSEKTADYFNFNEGNSILVISPFGKIKRNVKFNPSISEGIVFIPRAYNKNDVMNLFPLTDPETGDFEGFKRCQVRIEKHSGFKLPQT